MDNFTIRGYKDYCKKMHLRFTRYESLKEFRKVCEMLERYDKRYYKKGK